jgi:hypothetical protein
MTLWPGTSHVPHEFTATGKQIGVEAGVTED